MAKLHTPAMERAARKNTDRNGNAIKSTPGREAWKRLYRNKTALLGICIILFFVFVAIFADWLAPYASDEQNYSAMYQSPSVKHWFGTDEYGRDIFSRCLYGTRYSLGIGVCCVIASALTSGFLGIVAGYAGGKVDNIIMRIMDVLQAIPQVLLAIALVSVLGNGIPQLVLAVTLSSMPAISKSTRAAILMVRSNDYVESSRAIGVDGLQLIMTHLVPNAVGIIVIQLVSMLSNSIIIISSLSYIGVGISAPTPEWGAILNGGKLYFMTYPHMVLFPVMTLMLACFGFNLLGNGLRDAFDPRLK